MVFSPGFIRVMRGLGGEWGCRVIASRGWLLDFFHRGPPPVAVDRLRGKRERVFFEELVKLSDIRKFMDSRVVLVAGPGTVRPEEIQLATNAEVSVVLDGDLENFQKALGGGEISEVNRAAKEKLLGKKSRAASRECRSLILDLLSKKWMTGRELGDELRWRFDGRTVRAQSSRLRRESKVKILGRTNSGEGLLGMPGVSYQGRSDLSGPSRGLFLSQQVLLLLNDGPRDYRDIAEKLGVKAHVATAVLRRLSHAGEVEKAGEGWILKGIKKQ